ncbi:hypothetical protein T552_02871 [Pneumocystis carinii B80]|uniref:Glycosylphosphatidylinositol anchor biosynthesis protein 11 n=1 Tax=Pneumocystis carinii (strain B80) TaxID=1408658 RepID=A0A0W4ZDH9_PNEC8|nr:hypothetical protein T552_02871 [Pneumocystis carinii B80]KTW26389.1 hypothetical protein T552_02871 [Pneumocystis carinii B80]
MLLGTNLLRIYDIFHPLVPLFFLYLNFEALLIETTQTLIGSLFVPVFIVQILRFVVFVNLDKIHVLYECFVNRYIFLSYVKDIGISCLYFVFSCILVDIFIILYGAPVVSCLLETILSCLHLSVLGILPMICVFGVDIERYMELVSLELDLRDFQNFKLSMGFFGTFVGSWMGAMPILLDWNRDWQKWPIPVVLGGYLGYALSNFKKEEELNSSCIYLKR